MGATKFGPLFKAFRLRSGQTLRRFCSEHGFDPGNTSRLERGIIGPPESDEKLEELAAALQLRRDSEDWQQFFDIAAAERGRIPSDLLSDEELIAKLPVVFRTIRGSKTDGSSLDELVEKLREA